MSTAYSALLSEFLERHELGELGVTTATGDSSSVIDLTRFGGGSRAGNEYPQRSPILILTGDRAGEHTFKSDFDVDLGDFTVAPVLTGAPGSGASFAIAPIHVVNHFDRFLEALNRFLTTERRWDKIVLTMAGEAATLQGLTSLWSTTNATLAYVDGDEWTPQLSRWLSVTASASPGFAETTGIPVTADDVIDFWVLVWPPGTGTAELVIRDVTNGATITPTYLEGAATMSGAKPQAIRGYFTVPTGCVNVGARYNVSTSGQVGLFGPLAMAKRSPAGQTTYPVARAIEGPGHIGGLFTPCALPTAAAVPSQVDFLDEVWPPYDIEQKGFATVLKFTEVPPFPLFLDALIPYPALTGVTSTTHCPLELAVRGMAFEFFKWAGRRVRRKQGSPEATRFDDDLADAEADLEKARADYGAKQKLVIHRHYTPVVRVW